MMEQNEKLFEAIKSLESKFGQTLEIQQLNNTVSKTIGISVPPPPSGQPSPIINSNIDKEINLSSVVNDMSKDEAPLTSPQSVITTETPSTTKDQFQEDKQASEGNWGTQSLTTSEMDDQNWEKVGARNKQSKQKKIQTIKSKISKLKRNKKKNHQ